MRWLCEQQPGDLSHAYVNTFPHLSFTASLLLYVYILLPMCLVSDFTALFFPTKVSEESCENTIVPLITLHSQSRVSGSSAHGDSLTFCSLIDSLDNHSVSDTHDVQQLPPPLPLPPPKGTVTLIESLGALLCLWLSLQIYIKAYSNLVCDSVAHCGFFSAVFCHSSCCTYFTYLPWITSLMRKH